MKRKRTEKYKLGAADVITLCRIGGTMVLLFLRPLSAAFYCTYAITGITDVLDGWIARITHTESNFGAKLDSVADLLFYAVMLLKIFPILWNTLPCGIWYAVAIVLTIRLSAYAVAAFRYRRFASLHTYLNKLTGAAVFFIPFLINTQYAVSYCTALSVIAALASLEELIIHVKNQTYCADIKSIFCKNSSKD